MNIQGSVDFAAGVAAPQEPAAPKCLCCSEPAFGENVIDTGQLCLKHTELRIFVWRLQKRGEEISIGSLQEYMRQTHRPVTFSIGDVPELWKQYQAVVKGEGTDGQTEAA